MKARTMIFLLLAATQVAANAQMVTPPPTVNGTGSGTYSSPVSSPLPMFPEGDWSWADRRQRAEESDARSLQVNYYFALTSFTVKKGFSAEIVTDSTRYVRGQAYRGRETSMLYIDEAGRRRSAYKTGAGDERIMIIDPQRQVGYLIRPDHEDVLRISGTPHNPLSTRQNPSEGTQPKYVKQVTTPLGTKEIDGLTAAGTRTESYYPPGAVGNAKEVVETRESWALPQLGITAYWRTTSPYLVKVVEYRDIKLGNPPDSVFEIPANYKLRDVAAR